MKNLFDIMEETGVGKLPHWTISSKNKIPINPKLALEYNFDHKTAHIWLKAAKLKKDRNPESILVTLDDLLANENTPNRCALNVNVEKQKMIFIDIEKKYNKKFNTLLKKLPIIYAERSSGGGKHLIVPVSDDILQDIKYQKLFMKSVLKFGELSDEPHTGIEFFLRNHYITFTNDQLNCENNNTQEDLRIVLDELLTIINTQIVKTENFLSDRKNIPTDALVIKNHFQTPSNHKKIKKILNKIDKGSDLSVYEYKIIYIITENLLSTIRFGFQKNPIQKSELTNQKSLDDPKILIWVILDLAYDYLDKREKWSTNTTRDQNYIQYTCNKALNYCLQTRRN